ncbi:MAG: peptide chain release factor 1, partial [Nanoarchaeota archaeon]|nr:peptide chain release factor 1 [Nanoarchaeota archaeon]
HTKNEFVDGSYLNQELKDKVIAVQDLSYTGEFGLQELVEKSKDILAEEAITEEKDIMNKFLDMLSKDTGKAAYGEKEVEEALKLGAVETILISEEFDDKKSEEFEKKAENTGAVVRLISTETREGVQLKDLGGIAAILRFAIV